MHFTFNCRSEKIPRLLPCSETPRCCAEGKRKEEEGPFLHRDPGKGGGGCPSWCSAR